MRISQAICYAENGWHKHFMGGASRYLPRLSFHATYRTEAAGHRSRFLLRRLIRLFRAFSAVYLSGQNMMRWRSCHNTLFRHGA